MKNSRKSEIFIRYNSLQKEEEGERLSKKRDTWIIPIITKKPKVFLIAQRVWITICVGFCQVFCVWSNDGFLVRHAMSGSELLANIFFFAHDRICMFANAAVGRPELNSTWMTSSSSTNNCLVPWLKLWFEWREVETGDRDRKVKILIWNEDSN